MNMRSVVLCLAYLLIASRVTFAFPLTWDPYLRYLNVQVTEADVPDGTTYWRVARGYVVPPPDSGFGDVKIWYQAIDENGQPLYGVPVQVFRTSDGFPLFNGVTAGEYNMGGSNWLDFYNQLGPYSLKINDGQPTEKCMGLGLPANHHFSYTIVFQRAIKGVTPTGSQPTPLGQPDGTNLLTNPGAETNNLNGWSQQGMSIDGDIFANCGNRAGNHRFSWQTYGLGAGSMSQTVSVLPGSQYTFGFWVCKKSTDPAGTLTASWSDNNGGGGTLYAMPGGETIFPIYGVRQDATITPQGDQLTVTISMGYTGSLYAAFHLDEFWLIEVTPPGPPEILLTPTSLNRELIGGKTLTDDTFTIDNIGESTLEYTVSEDVDWLTVDPIDGTCASETDTITIRYNTADVEVGSHQAIISVIDPDASNSPAELVVNLTVRVPGDFDNDDDVDQEDFGQFQVCLTGTGNVQNDPDCQRAKLDEDQDVDQEDFGIFQACMTASGTPGSIACLATQP